MAGEIQVPYNVTGITTMYAIIRNAIGQVWYPTGGVFEAYNAAHYTNYAIALSEQGANGVYVGDFPSAIASGVYGIASYYSTGTADPSDCVRLTGMQSDFQWSGTAVVSLDSRSKPADNQGIDWGNISNKSTNNQLTGTVIYNASFLYTAIVLSGPYTAAGGGASTITLNASGALGFDNACIGCRVDLINGTGAPASAIITGYVNSTRVVTVDNPWVVQPDNTTTYQIARDHNGRTSATGYYIADVQQWNSASVNNLVGGNVPAAVADKTGFSLANGSFLTATFGTCDFTADMKASLNAATPSVTVSDKTGFSLLAGSFTTATFNAACDFNGIMKVSLTTAATAATPTVTLTSAYDAAKTAAQASSFSFTVAGVVDANIQYVNDIQVKGTGTNADPWNPV